MSNTFVGFSITNSITNEVVNCYFSSKSVMKEVFSLIESVNNPSLLIPSSTMKPIPLSSKVLKKRCEFSHSVVTEHDIFVGGILSDIIEYVLIHMGKLGIGKYNFKFYFFFSIKNGKLLTLNSRFYCPNWINLLFI